MFSATTHKVARVVPVDSDALHFTFEAWDGDTTGIQVRLDSPLPSGFEVDPSTDIPMIQKAWDFFGFMTASFTEVVQVLADHFVRSRFDRDLEGFGECFGGSLDEIGCVHQPGDSAWALGVRDACPIFIWSVDDAGYIASVLTDHFSGQARLMRVPREYVWS